jgi:hypothetical protein
VSRLGRLALGLLLVASAASAQTPDSTRRAADDTLRVGRDSLPADSLATDSLRQTARFLSLRERERVLLAVAPRLNADGPRPDGSRVVFTADSLAHFNGESVADLLAQVPGVYVWRGGWLGRQAYANYRGRGAAGVEYLLDGVPYLPAGADSVAVDAGRLQISLYERVEIERLPGLLRVHLFTPRRDRYAAASRVQIGTGSDGLTKFAAAIEQRSQSGFGLSLFGDYLDVAPSVGAPFGGSYRNTHLGLLLQYAPSRRRGVELMALRSRPVRGPFAERVAGGGDPEARDAGLAERRSDLRARAFLRSRDDGTGFGLDLVAARTSVSDTLADTLAVPQLAQRVDAAGVIIGLRGARAFLTGEAWLRNRWTRSEARVRSGWSRGTLTVAGDAVIQRHVGGRESRWVHGRIGVRRGPWSVGASTRFGDVVALPSVTTNTAQSVRELEGTAAVDADWIGLYGTVTRTNAFTPPVFATFPGIALIGTAAPVTWVSGGGRLRPFSWLTLESWASTPMQGTALGQPPMHAVSTGTIRTKFLRVFPSGVLDLRLQLGLECWGTGTLGADVNGDPVTVPATSHVFAQAEASLLAFTIYYQQRNTAARAVAYVPGFRIPSYANYFGLRWHFTN